MQQFPDASFDIPSSLPLAWLRETNFCSPLAQVDYLKPFCFLCISWGQGNVLLPPRCLPTSAQIVMRRWQSSSVPWMRGLGWGCCAAPCLTVKQAPTWSPQKIVFRRKKSRKKRMTGAKCCWVMLTGGLIAEYSSREEAVVFFSLVELRMTILHIMEDSSSWFNF